MRSTSFVYIPSDTCAAIVDARETGALRRIRIRVNKKDKIAAMLEICLRTRVVVVYNVSDDIAGIVYSVGGTDTRKRRIRELGGIKYAERRSVAQHAVSNTICITHCADELPLIVDTRPERRS